MIGCKTGNFERVRSIEIISHEHEPAAEFWSQSE